MASVVRPVGYVANLQRLTWPLPQTTTVIAHLWGGGGGAGGWDASHYGGNGGGGGYSRKSFTLNYGDVLDIAVGGYGNPGQSSQTSAPGGSAGQSYSNSVAFTTLDFLGSGVYKYSYGVYPAFLNTYGVWNYAGSFDHSRSINFGAGGTYNISGTCDNEIHVYVDGVEVLSGASWQNIYSGAFTVSSGYHTVRVLGYNYGGPASIAVTITGGNNFGGGNGGRAGASGSSGAGGGGGGASVLLLNSSLIAVAGGGGGGGGSGNQGNGGDAPGASGQTSAGTWPGQNGQFKDDDGGGGGAGGGGYAGGNGGLVNIGDFGASGGCYGSNLGDYTENPNGRLPGGATSDYYTSGTGVGGIPPSNSSNGVGGPASIVLDFDIAGLNVHYLGSFQPVKKVYVKLDNVWQPVQATYIKNAGTWKDIVGSFAPTFVSVPGSFGANPRVAPDAPTPEPEPAPYWDGGYIGGYNNDIGAA